MTSLALAPVADNTVVNHVNFGPYTFLLADENKTMFKCERGFFWAKDQAPEIVTTGVKDEWGPNKELVHYRDENSQLKPFREDKLDLSWRKSITHASTARLSEIEASGQTIVDCRV